jgi:outer membrane cobalamin receptor
MRGAAISAKCLAHPLFAGAQTELAESGTLQEIVVTAQKREQKLQEVGASITAFDAKIGRNPLANCLRQELRSK